MSTSAIWFDTLPCIDFDIRLFDKSAPVPRWFILATQECDVAARTRTLQELFLRWGIQCAWNAGEIRRERNQAGLDHDIRVRRGPNIPGLPVMAPDHLLLIRKCPSVRQPAFNAALYGSDNIPAALLDWSILVFGHPAVKLVGMLLRWGLLCAEHSTDVKRLIGGKKIPGYPIVLDRRTLLFN